MDIDLRRPSVHRCFNLENRNGFVEMVTQGTKLEDAVYRDVAKNLDVLTSGARCPNPAELLSGTGFAEVLATALKTYDRVVIDCSPVNLVSDSLLIASSIQSVCLVVRAARPSAATPSMRSRCSSAPTSSSPASCSTRCPPGASGSTRTISARKAPSTARLTPPATSK